MMKRQTVRAEWVDPKACISCQSCTPSAPLSRRLAEVGDEMKAVHDLHRLRRPLANALAVQVTAGATDHGHRRMLGQLGRHGGGGAL
jgi:hypothetical protein